MPNTKTLRPILSQVSTELSKLHLKGSAHGNITMDNIVMRSSQSSPCGFAIKYLTGSKTTKKLEYQDFADNCVLQSVVIPPEVEAGEPYGLSADIWALGQLHIQLLTEDMNRRDTSLGLSF